MMMTAARRPSTRPLPLIGLLAGLAACAPGPPAGSVADSAARAAGQQAARSFLAVVDQVEPVAEEECRTRTRGIDCDFRIFVDDRIDQPPNAFQTVDRRGRPVIVFTLTLIADARNPDELAFILGHEAAHHIEGHIPRAQAGAELGALILGTLAEASGQTRQDVQAAVDLGAEVGARRFAKAFELEADALGTVIAHNAGFDPVRGAQFFDRIPDPGDQFLGTHPPNAERQALVARVAATLN